MSDAPTPAPPNCPFYGRHLAIIDPRARARLGHAIRLLPNYGNQCAIVNDSVSPCQPAIEGKSVEWRGCPILADILVDIRSLSPCPH